MRLRRTPEIISGRVTSAGIMSAGHDFSVVRSATGTFTVTLPIDFRLISATATLVAGFGAGVTANISSYTQNTFTVFIAGSAGAAQDQPFSFIAVSS